MILHDGPESSRHTVLLAHGAGAPMDHPFMETFARGIAAGGHHVARFEFPYMARRRDGGGKKPPDRLPVLLDAWRAAADELGPVESLVVGGKSLGARTASLMADDLGAAGLVCLGFPFHAPGRPEKVKLHSLPTLETPALIVQGERDPFGRKEEVEGYELSDAIRLHFLCDGDHGFKPRKSSGRTEEQNWREGIDAVLEFLANL